MVNHRLWYSITWSGIVKNGLRNSITWSRMVYYWFWYSISRCRMGFWHSISWNRMVNWLWLMVSRSRMGVWNTISRGWVMNWGMRYPISWGWMNRFWCSILRIMIYWLWNSISMMRVWMMWCWMIWVKSWTKSRTIW